MSYSYDMDTDIVITLHKTNNLLSCLKFIKRLNDSKFKVCDYIVTEEFWVKLQ